MKRLANFILWSCGVACYFFRWCWNKIRVASDRFAPTRVVPARAASARIVSACVAFARVASALVAFSRVASARIASAYNAFARSASAFVASDRIASTRVAGDRVASVLLCFHFLLTIACGMILKPVLFEGIFNLAYLPQDIDFAVILKEILRFWVHLRQ